MALGLTVPLEIINPENFNSLRPNSHLIGFTKRELDLSLDKTYSMYWRCSEVEDKYIGMSCKYTVQKWSRDFLKTLFASLWNVLRALLRPSSVITFAKRSNLV